MRISSLNRFITLPEKETDAKVVLSKLDAKAVLSSFPSSQEEGMKIVRMSHSIHNR